MEDTEFLSREYEPQHWAVESLFPEGLTIVAATGKTGKSIMIGNVAIDVAYGSKVFGRFPTNPGDVLYIANEGLESSWQTRFARMFAARNVTPNGRFHFYRNWKKLVNGGLYDLDNWLNDHPETRMVVIDVLRNFMPIRGWSQNEDADLIAGLSNFALQHRIALVAVHHTNRQVRGRDWVQDIQGTLGVSAAADAIMMLRRERNAQTGVLLATGKDIAEMSLPLTFDYDNYGVVIAEDAEIDNGVVGPMSDERLTLLAYIERNPGQTAPEIAKGLGKSYDSIRTLLWNMNDQRQVRRVNARFYTLTQFEALKKLTDDPQQSFTAIDDGSVVTLTTEPPPSGDDLQQWMLEATNKETARSARRAMRRTASNGS